MYCRYQSLFGTSGTLQIKAISQLHEEIHQGVEVPGMKNLFFIYLFILEKKASLYWQYIVTIPPSSILYYTTI